MRVPSKILLGCFFFFLLTSVQAQDSSQVEVEKQLEEAFEELDTEETGLTGEQLTQFLEDLASNPININSAGVNELLQIPGFNLILARAVIDFRRNNPFERVSDIQRVSGIGAATFQRMRPYITVGGVSDRFANLYTNPGYWLSGNQFEYISRYQQNIQDQEGFLREDSLGGYTGNAVKYYQRLRMRSDHLSLNLTQEKDAGETLSGPTDFDFNSWHIELRENGNLKNLVVGDYSLSFGQGLVLWTGGAFGKGREVTGTVNKNERGLRAYGSAQETDFFRGIAATYGNRLQVTGFYSSRPRTASVINGDTTNFPSSSGFHRTLSEIERRNNIDQETFGGRVTFDSPLGYLGVTGYQTTFNSYIEAGSSLSDLFDFEGKSNSVFGVDYRGLVGNSFLFAEAARSENGGLGLVSGLEAPIGLNTDIAILYRNYQKDFQSFLGDGFGESSGDPNNENGIYLGIAHGLSNRFTISGYIDQYSFNAPRSGNTQPTQGYDVLGLIEGSLSRNLNVYVLIRNEVKDDEFLMTDQEGREVITLGNEKRASIRIQTEYQINRQVRLRTRGEFVRFQGAGEDWESGILIYQDLRILPSRKLQIDARITLFDTDSFDTRLYQFENDLLYVLSNTALSDRGQRMYMVLKYEATEWIDIWAKYSITIIEDAQTLSSGLGEIQGNKRSFIGLQARIQIR
ncbi:MAG: helix-hairpin-helix domain-containing protein [Balneola sp.]|nr:MAG: helix-hairpin-helix domain-containing protein [Balneola sp.]